MQASRMYSLRNLWWAAVLAVLCAVPAFAQTAQPAAAQPVAAEQGLWAFILTAFGAGLIALITPCVFPLIPVTFAFFTKQATQTGTSLVKLATVYCIGIITAFTGLGAIMAVTVGAAGANRLAANPWVNLLFAVIFVFFGLALLEVVDLSLPSGIQNLINRRPEQNAEPGSGAKPSNPLPTVLFMGLTFVIAAFTCTAPFIGTVLVAAASATSGAQWVRPIVGMTAFATALALPFFLLALFPGLLAKLPRSGAWLSTVKGAMGFIELAAALKFLSNADMVWGWGIVTRPLVLSLCVALTFAAAAWLMGRLNLGFSTPSDKISIGRGISASLFAALGVYFLIGLTGRPLYALEGSFLPPITYGYGTQTTEGKTLAATSPNAPREFKNDLDGGLALAKERKGLVFIDFTGYTCANCRWMEQNIFVVPSVKAEKEKFVSVILYTDEEKQKDKDGNPLGDKLQEYQEKNFGTVAQPLYAVLKPDGKPVLGADGKPLTFAHNTDPAKFVAFLQEAQQRAGQVL